MTPSTPRDSRALASARAAGASKSRGIVAISSRPALWAAAAASAVASAARARRGPGRGGGGRLERRGGGRGPKSFPEEVVGAQREDELLDEGRRALFEIHDEGGRVA